MSIADPNMAMKPVAALANADVSLWLDDLGRAMLSDGRLESYMRDLGVVGVTTNPSIFAAALRDGSAYAAQVKKLSALGVTAEEAALEMTAADVARACELMTPIYESSHGRDGRVSIEVDPRLAHDTAGTVAQAKYLWEKINKPNLLIKIPATMAGLPAITAVIAAGISVNATLIFSVERYRMVAEAYMSGLEKAVTQKIDISKIHSVASFFVSRMDTKVDGYLDKIGSSAALAARGKSGVANARLAYEAFAQSVDTPRWVRLAAKGAHAQRPLWASTGVKNPNYPDTLYVDELVAPDTVNTLPLATLQAAADHAQVDPWIMQGSYDLARSALAAVEAVGVSYEEVVSELEIEGVTAFVDAWNELLGTVNSALQKA